MGQHRLAADGGGSDNAVVDPSTVISASLVADGLTFLEGPRWHDGALWVSDFYNGMVLSFPDGCAPPQVIAHVPAQPSGLGWNPDGDLLVVSMLDRRILRQTGGRLVPFADAGALVVAPLNDMYVDPAGWCLVGNLGHASGDEASFGPTPLLRVSAHGQVTVAAQDLNFPNGIVRRPDGIVLVAETFAGRITAFDCDDDGRLSRRRRFVDWGPETEIFDIARATAELPLAPDGMAVDRTGAVWVAGATGHGALRLDQHGRPAGFVDTGHYSAYAVALDERDQRLFLCCAPPLGTVDVAATRSGVLMVAQLI